MGSVTTFSFEMGKTYIEKKTSVHKLKLENDFLEVKCMEARGEVNKLQEKWFPWW